jgi:putative phosphoribosyl transferase
MTAMAPFKNRTQAGELLAELLHKYAVDEHAADSSTLILALPRGGIPVGHAISAALGIPLDILIVRKLGVPWHEEYAMGAVASGGIQVLQQEILDKADIPQSAVEAATHRELREIERREQLYRAGRPAIPLEGKTVILVDDGLATGSTMLAAVRAVASRKPRKIIVAVPVGAADSCGKLAAEADEVICLRTPSPFIAVGKWYEDFPQVSDDEAVSLLSAARANHAGERP